jgi:F0F1-type ATP synthase membrane subunit b/b'
MSFKTQIEDLVGAVGDDDLISTSIQDIGAEIVSALPINKLLRVAKTAAVSSSGLTTAGKKVLAVDKDDLPVKEIPAMQKAKYNDTGSIYAASDTNAVYYIEDEIVKVNGAAGSGATSGVLHYVPKIPTSDGSTAIVHGGSTVTNFPQEAERLLVLGGAVRCLQRLMADKTSSLPTDISDITLPVSPTAPSAPSFTYTDVSVSDIVQPIISVSDMASMTETAPSYISPVIASSFNIVDTFISTDEDVELASAKIQEINTQIGEFQYKIQNALNSFNQENIVYQQDIQRKIQNLTKSSQVAIQNAQQEYSTRKANIDKEIQVGVQNAIQNFQEGIEEYKSSLGKYSAEIQDYQSEVSATVQKYGADIQNYGSKIQKHFTDYQWKQGQYQQLKAEYMQGLQLLISGGIPQQQGA